MKRNTRHCGSSSGFQVAEDFCYGAKDRTAYDGTIVAYIGYLAFGLGHVVVGSSGVWRRCINTALKAALPSSSGITVDRFMFVSAESVKGCALCIPAATVGTNPMSKHNVRPGSSSVIALSCCTHYVLLGP